MTLPIRTIYPGWRGLRLDLETLARAARRHPDDAVARAFLGEIEALQRQVSWWSRQGAYETIWREAMKAAHARVQQLKKDVGERCAAGERADAIAGPLRALAAAEREVATRRRERRPRRPSIPRPPLNIPERSVLDTEPVQPKTPRER